MGIRDRHAIAPYGSVRIGIVLSAFLYVLISLNPSEFAPSLLKRLTARTTVKTEAIAMPAASMGGNPQAHESGHSCCCRHTGAECEMGCCRGGASKEAFSGEACYRQCPGTDAMGNPEVPKLPTHLASSEKASAADPAVIARFSAPSEGPSASFRSPPEKIPIV